MVYELAMYQLKVQQYSKISYTHVVHYNIMATITTPCTHLQQLYSLSCYRYTAVMSKYVSRHFRVKMMLLIIATRRSVKSNHRAR